MCDIWIVVSPQRAKRPWQGQVEKTATESIPRHDPKNPLCPRVERPNGQVSFKFYLGFRADIGVQMQHLYFFRCKIIVS